MSNKPRLRSRLSRPILEKLEDRTLPAAFTAGDLVIYRLGDGSATPTSSATAVFLDEYTTSGSLVQSIAVPTTASGSNHILTASGTATSEGALSRSADGQFLVFAGYDAAPGTTSVASTATSSVVRVIGLAGVTGSIDTSTSTTAFSGTNIRSATSTDGNDVWAAGTNTGVVTNTLGGSGAGTIVSNTTINLRVIQVFDGQLYVSSSSGSLRLGTVGNGTPTTTGNSTTNLPGFPTGGLSPYGYFFADLSSSISGVDTLYVADDTASGGQIQKYSLVSGSWTATGAINLSAARGVTGVVNSDGSVSLYATSQPTSSQQTLVSITDTSGYNGTLSASPTTLAAAANTFFRGIALAPNAAPVLSGANDFSAITQDDVNNAGTLVSALISGQVSDDNANPLTGIALTATATSNGSWQYTTDGGSNWNDVGSVSGSSALLLAADSNTRLRFVPNSGFHGTVSNAVTFRAWDQTSGTAGSTVDVSSNGGGTTFSSATASPSITVNSAVSLTPSVTNATTKEDAQTTSGLVITNNSGDGGTTAFYKITNVSNGKLFENDGTTPISSGDFITRAEGAAGLKFTPNADFFGSGSFDVQASTSNTNAGLGGSVVTATITVDPVADTPSVTNATTSEDVQTTSGLVVSRNGADGGEVTHFEITNVTNGTLFLNDGTTPVSNNSFITLAQANAGLKFTPSANFFGAGSFGVQASLSNSDAGLGGGVVTATITVNPVADTPSVTNATTNEDVQATSGLVISRNGADGGEVTHFQITNVTNGALFLNDGTTPVSNNSFITSAEAGAGLKFTPNANFFGTGSFQVQASLSSSDGGLGGGVVTATITVNPVADTPSVTNATTSEDVQTTSGLVVSRNGADGGEVTHFEITNVTNGALFLADGTTPVSNNSFITFAQANAGLTFTPSANFFGTGSFQIQASLSSSDGGLGGSVVTATITVDPVADTPSVTDAATTKNKQTTSGLVVSRNAADGGEVTHVKITNVTNGQVFLNDGTTAVNDGDFITFDQANAGLKFTPSLNFVGPGSFDVQASTSASDGGLGGGVVTATITVSAFALTPSVTNATTNEDVQSTSGLVITNNAGDGGTTTHYKITGVTNGTLFLADGTTQVANNSFITLAQGAAGLKFTPDANFFGTGSFQVQASTSNGDAGLDGNVVTATITVNPVADTPSVTNATTNEDVQTTSGLVVSRNGADGGEVTHFEITNVTNGALFLADGTTPVSNNSFITFAQANAGLKFTPDANFFGAGSFGVQASLSNSDAGLGGGVVTATITVNPVADTPSVTNATTNEDVQTSSGLVISRNVADGGEVTHFQITNVTNGTLFENDGTTPVNGGDFITSAEAGAGLKFTPNANFFGTGSFQVQASTSNGVADLGGGVVTATITVNPVADTPSVTNATTNEDVQTTTGLVVSRNAVDGTEVTHFKITNVANGTLFLHDGTTQVSSGSFITFAQANAGLKFTPSADIFGTGSFQVQASLSNSDAGLGGGVATATITVIPVADTPSVTNATTSEDVQTTSGLVISRNPVDGSEVTHFRITNVANGTLFLHDGTTQIASGSFITFAQANAGLKFTPSPNFFGAGSFDVQASTSNGVAGLGGSVVTASITVNPVADTPSVTNATTNEDVQTTSGLVVSRNGADGSEVTHFEITNIQNGLLFLADGTTAVHDGDFITFAQANAGLKFTPDANENDNTSTFGFTVQASTSASDAGLGGNPVDAMITVNPVNDEPTFHLAQTAITVNEDAPAVSRPGFVTNVQAGPADEAASQTVSLDVSNDNHALFSAQPTLDAGGKLTFTVAPNAFGAATVTVTATDSGPGASPDDNTSFQTFTITVHGVADTPSVTDATTNEDTQTSTGLVVSRNPADGNEATYFEVLSVTNGTLFASDGTTQILAGSFVPFDEGAAGLRFTPGPNFFGTATVTIQASTDAGDDGLGGAVVTATITVNPVNDAPVAADDFFTAAGSKGVPRPATLPVLSNDTDVDGPSLSIVSVTQGSAGGKVSISGGQIVYVPARGFGGTETFTYTVSDGELTDTATVTVAVQAPATAPAVIAAATDAGVPAVVRLYDAATGTPLREFSPYEGYDGGVRVAQGDVNGDGVPDLVTATAGAVGHVKAFDGVTGAEIRSFMPFGDYPSGLYVSVGDLDGDGFADVVVGLESGPAHVKAFSGRTGELMLSFIAYEGFAGGVRVAAGDLDGDGFAEIATVAGPGGDGHIKAFDGRDLTVLQSYLAYVAFAGDVQLAIAQLQNGGVIVTSAVDPVGGIHAVGARLDGSPVLSFFAAEAFAVPKPTVRPIPILASGRVAAIDLDGDGVDELVFSQGPGSPTRLLAQDPSSQAVLDELFAFGPQFTGGAYVG